ncbi:hypothetical protein D8Y22_01060 [Salinadaptatus halalkaliphilus]|uniref:Halobacterial output domain-containing protein n=1 Tax=Salinadaptatus halalkaliphilus TaxID=2419781 RepID=A0A4S3TQS9_9EURY|nr:HalOD1 output domain-containing protein [Salinadaptatus halalkaliphilus]THE66742.1 hypothetical protein D8Y22_01060 [Salinadaptatus halalkaliphilus]
MVSADDDTDTPASADSSYVTTFDPSTDDQPSERVVSAVASLRDEDPLELSPLYDAVEPEALDALVDHANRVDEAGTHRLWFAYEGFDIGVQSDGQIEIVDPTAESAT